MDPKKQTIWREGSYVDLWSLIHFLSGVVSALLAAAVGLPFILGIIVFTLLAILWEYFEYKKLIWETGQNRVTDVMIGIAAFWLGYYLFETLALSFREQLILLVSTGTALGVLSFFGWKALYAANKK